MHDASSAEIDAATAYEKLFVKALFGPWSAAVLDAADIGQGDRVLDVACGTGILARDAMKRVRSAETVTGLDPNPGMLAVADRLEPDVDWKQGVAESLPFPDHAFDAVVSQFGLMFFDDRRLALQEMYRVLSPGGRMVVAVWDSLESMPPYGAAVSLLDRIGGPQAAAALRAPFVLGDEKELAALFASAGIPQVHISRAGSVARFPSIRSMVEADLRGWLPVMGVELTDDQIGRILSEAEQVFEHYVTPTGSFEFATSANIVVVNKT